MVIIISSVVLGTQQFQLIIFFLLGGIRCSRTRFLLRVGSVVPITRFPFGVGSVVFNAFFLFFFFKFNFSKKFRRRSLRTKSVLASRSNWRRRSNKPFFPFLLFCRLCVYVPLFLTPPPKLQDKKEERTCLSVFCLGRPREESVFLATMSVPY